MAEEEKPKAEKKEVKEATLVEVTTQTAPAIQLEDGTIVDELELQLRIYNKLCKVERAVA